MLLGHREATGLGDYVRQRASWVGVEPRPPLFDPDLIEFALTIPPDLAFDSYLDRPVGREAMAGLLPDTVRLSRRKSNLAPFYHRSLADADFPLIQEILGSKRLKIEPWVDRAAIRALIERPPAAWESGWAQWQTALWGCVTTESWLRSLSDSTSWRGSLKMSGSPTRTS